MQIITLEQVGSMINHALGYVVHNLPEVLLIVGFIVGLSIVLALFDIAAENKRLENYGKRWR